MLAVKGQRQKCAINRLGLAPSERFKVAGSNFGLTTLMGRSTVWRS